jgi:quinol monooxygenase YgiN
MKLTRYRLLTACLPLFCISLILNAQAPQAAKAALTGPGLIVTYLEAPAAKAAALSADLQAYARKIEGGPGKPRVTIFKEGGRPNRMAALEQWPDMASADYAQAETILAAKVQADVLSPMDRRVNHPMTSPLAQPTPKAFVVLMHIDIGGAGAASVPKIVEAQRDAVLAAPGALAYEVSVQDQHTNHFALCEFWASHAAYEAYIATAAAEDFRRALAPLIGSPFDDRFYSVVSH